MDLNDLRIPANRHGYIYLTTFTRPTDSKQFFYVGQHLGKRLDKGYVGSGFRLKQMFKKYGRRGHVRLLHWAYSQEELNFKEQMSIVFAKLIYGKACLNLNHSDAVGPTCLETRRKQSEVQHKRTPEQKKAKSDKQRASLANRSDTAKKSHYDKIAEALHGRTLPEAVKAKQKSSHEKRPIELELSRRQKISSALRVRGNAVSNRTRPPRSEEHCRKLSESKQNRTPLEKELTSRKLQKIFAERKPEIEKLRRERISVARKGLVYSDESKKKMSESRRKVKNIGCAYCKRYAHPSHIARYHKDGKCLTR